MKKDVQNIVIGAVFIMGLALMTNFVLFDKEINVSTQYFAQFQNADGIKINTPVYMAGVKIGKVKNIALKNGLVDLTLNIKPNIKIPQDSMLKIETLDLFSTKILSVSPGFKEETLANNDYFQSVQNSVDFIGLLNSYLDSRINTIKKKKNQ